MLATHQAVAHLIGDGDSACYEVASRRRRLGHELADSCRKLVEGGAEERVAALRDGRGVQRATVVGEPRPAVHHGGRVERGDGVPVGHRDCRPSGLSLPALQHMGWRVLAVLKGICIRRLPRSTPGSPTPAVFQSISATQRSSSHTMLPPQTSPCTNTDTAAGTRCDLTRSSARCKRGVVGIQPRRRSVARSSTAIGRGRYGSSACDSKTTALTLAIAAPASRRRTAETIGGRSLLPDRKVSRVATVPLALPSRSAAIRRGATRPWASASRRARAFVITMPSVVQRGTESFRIRSVAPVDLPSTRRRKVPGGQWVLREGFSTERTRIPPSTPATQRRTCSLGNAPVCATPSPSTKGSIAAKLIRDAPTTRKPRNRRQVPGTSPVRASC